VRVQILILLTLLYSSQLYSQTNIGGIINTYLVPTGFDDCTNSATVPNTNGISPGDFVLIIQMKGADIDQSNSATYGNIQNYQSAGLYEVAQISSVSSNSITFVNALINQYEVTGLVQLVICPNYTNVTVTSVLTAPAWNGTVGGIVFLHAVSVSLSSSIDVTGLGFRGGTPSNNYYSASNCATLDYTTTLLLGAYKGEGIFSTSVTTNYGRGKNANGGGGGNNLNAGGGGGGNGGSGGKGGNQWSGCGPAINGGLGGGAMNFTDHLFLGGGGGGGHQNNSESTTGGKGGGIIVIKTNALTTNNNPIRSNGASVTVVTGIDAAGGGGGGGAILIQSPTINGNLVVEAKGGNGGNVNNGFTGGAIGGQCHGTGGGGGGGFIAVSSTGAPTINNNLAGGLGGQNINPQSNCYNQNFGSENGLPGFIVLDQIIPESTFAPTPSWTVSSVVIPNMCDFAAQDGQISLTVSPANNYVYSWSHDSFLNNPIASGLTSGSYSVHISNGGCSFDTTIIVSTILGINAVNTTIENESCNDLGSIEIIGVLGGTLPYLTSMDGITYTPAMSFPDLSSGMYTIYVEDGNGCIYDFTSTIEDNESISLTIVNQSNCLLQTVDVTLSAFNSNNGNFTYNLGGQVTTTGVYTDLTSGDYALTVLDDQGCSLDTTFTIPPFYTMDSLVFSVQSDYCENSNGVFILEAAYGDFINPVYTFQNETISIAENIAGLQSGTYSLEVFDINGCAYDTLVVISSFESAPFNVDYSLEVPGCDKSGSFIINEVNGGVAPYLYSFNGGAYNSNLIFPYDKNGLVELVVIDSVGCSFDYPILLEGSTELETLYIPNIFTPDEDEFNPTWFVKGNCIAEFNCIILNRWGQLLFESKDFNGHWDGTYDGKICQDGVYFYKVDVTYYSGKKDSHHGHITLIR